MSVAAADSCTSLACSTSGSGAAGEERAGAAAEHESGGRVQRGEVAGVDHTALSTHA